MAYWDQIAEFAADALEYCVRNEATDYRALSEILDRLADDDGQLTNLDDEMVGLRTFLLQSAPEKHDLLVAVRDAGLERNVLMCVAIRAGDGRSNAYKVSDDEDLKMRLNLGRLKLFER